MPSRSFLLAARLVALATLTAVLWNPQVRDWSSDRGAQRFVILDASASMTALGRDGAPLWDRAAARARELAADGARVLLAGDAVRAVAADSIGGAVHRDARSLLAPAVAVAAEAGAQEITVLTDGRLEDPAAAVGTARRLGVGLVADTAWGVTGAAPNLGLARLVVPAAVDGSGSVAGRVEVEGNWNADSVAVSISVDGVVRQALWLGGEEGRGTRVAAFELVGRTAAGARRISARIEHADAFPADDERAAIVRTAPEETGILLLALASGWESRFLLPVLKQVTGLPVRGFLRTGADRYHPMDPARGEEGEGSVGAAAMRSIVRQAGVVVAIGVDESNRESLEQAVGRARRLVIFAKDEAGAAMGGVAVDMPLAGEWYVETAPPSPVAGDLAGVSWQGLPPLTGLLPARSGSGWIALSARRTGDDETQAVVVLREEAGGRRVSTALASGFWRWAFRDGLPREAYRRLWAAVGGWAAAGDPPSFDSGTRPADDVVPRGSPVRWRAGSAAGDVLSLAVWAWPAPSSPAGLGLQGPSRLVLDTALAVPDSGSFFTPALAPGEYEYRAVSAADTATGRFEVEQFTPEMLRAAVDPSVLSAPSPSGGAGRAVRPLRTSPLPYLVVLAVLCAEWIGRRRAGLR